jgi:hypothetical protein
MKPTFIALLALCLPLMGADKKKSGTVLWELKTGGPVSSSPAIGSDGTIYVGSNARKLYAINGKSGTFSLMRCGRKTKRFSLNIFLRLLNR